MHKQEKMNSLNKRTILRILKYIKKYRFLVVLSLLCAAVSVILTLYAPIVIGHAVDKVVGEGLVDFSGLKGMLIRLIVVVAITALSQWIMNVLNNKITYNVVNDVRTKAYEKLGRAYYESRSENKEMEEMKDTFELIRSKELLIRLLNEKLDGLK